MARSNNICADRVGSLLCPRAVLEAQRRPEIVLTDEETFQLVCGTALATRGIEL